ncbi:hypothetical protein [Salinigranum sp. GCM10025319]|uniref:hypothetical protein n=1 Tax=Salinigranum sp. GCM10025319 TaxID=3252687 RepID=UPI003615DD37
MAHRTLALVGLLEALFPRGVIELGERLAFRDRGESVLRSWVVPVARLEGLLWVLAARRGSGAGPFLGVAGLPLVLAPKRTVDAMLSLVYKNSDTIELAPWVVPVTRVLGLVYVAVGWRSMRRSKSTGEAEAE